MWAPPNATGLRGCSAETLTACCEQLDRDPEVTGQIQRGFEENDKDRVHLGIKDL
jgi:hypothetical protein